MSWNWFRAHVANTVPSKPIKFHSAEGASATLQEIIQKSVPDLYDGATYNVHPLLLTGHLQTAYTGLNKFEGVDHVHYKRRILQIESDKKVYHVDGDTLKYDQWQGESTVAVDYVVPESASDPDHVKFKPESQTKDLPPRTEYLDPAKEDEIFDDSKPLLVALHGLSGGSYESYLRALLIKITGQQYGFDALVLNSRGCANHTLTSPQLFNGLWTNDLRYLINEHIRVKWPNKKVYLIGFSLGGAIVSNYLGQEASDVYPMIKGAVAMGTPWDFVDSSIQLSESLVGDYVYSPTMGQNLLRLLNEHAEDGHLKHNPFVIEFKKNPEKFQIRKLKEFDDLFTSKLFGFNNANEYYRHASPIQRLHKVRVPFVIISSKDDPITGCRTLPYKEVEQNPYALLITTSTGGHLGWFKRGGQRWYPDPVSQCLTQLNQWLVDKESISEDDLPMELGKTWKHDRIIYGM